MTSLRWQRLLEIGYLSVLAALTAGVLPLLLGLETGVVESEGFRYMLWEYGARTLLRFSVIVMGVGSMLFMYTRPDRALLVLPFVFVLTVAMVMV